LRAGSGSSRVQAKLAVSRPGDPEEVEADRVANAVLHASAGPRESALWNGLSDSPSGAGARNVVQRQPVATQAPACPISYEPGEVAQSRTPAGILGVNVVEGPERLDIQDFAIGRSAIPQNVVESMAWQR